MWPCYRYANYSKVRAVLAPLAATVEILLMAKVGLRTIPDVITANFTKLRVFVFTANWLEFLPPNTFDRLLHLEYLDLRLGIWTFDHSIHYHADHALCCSAKVTAVPIIAISVFLVNCQFD
jgi:hypothetical protein